MQRIDRKRQRLGRLSPRLRICEPLEERLVLDSTVVFNELMYHPAGLEATAEWIELYNQNAVDMDLSGWSIDGGIHYTFPQGTVMLGGSYLVVAANKAALQAATGFSAAFGDYTGLISNSGEKLQLINQNQRVMDEVDFKDDGQWPVAPDGSGVSLAKIDPETASEPAANWRASALIGGTLGQRNFTPPNVSGPQYETLLTQGATARLRIPTAGDAALGTGWTASNYNDAAWTNATSGVGFDTDTPVLATGTTNLALNKPIIKSSGTYAGLAGFEADNVTDGSTSDIFSSGAVSSSSYWLGHEGVAQEYFILDLQSITNIKEIRLRNTHNTQYNDRGTANFQIYASNSVTAANDLVNPTLILGGTLAAVTGQAPITAQTFNATNGLSIGSYRYLRFNTLTSTYANNNIGLNEIEVYGLGVARPIGYWPVEGNALDVSGNNFTASLNGPTFISDAPAVLGTGQSLNFDGVNDYFITPNLTAQMTGNESMTLSVWYKARTGGNGGVVVDELGQNGLNTGFHLSQILVDPSGEVRVQVSGVAPLSLGVASLGQWHHVALRYDKATLSLQGFVDGVLKATGSGDRAAPWEVALAQHYALGSLETGSLAGGYFDGQMDDFAVYNKPLSNTQIAALATGTAPQNLVGYLGLIGTDVAAAMQNVNSSAWLRFAFAAATPSRFDVLTMQVQYDDGFVAYLNGVEVARRNAPPTTAWDSMAASDRPHKQAIVVEEINLSAFLGSLTPGQNVLAIHGLNNSASDPNFIILPQLQARVAEVASLSTPLAINEVASASDGQFFIELTNYGAASIPLGGYVLAHSAATGIQSYTLPAQSLAPGGFLSLSAATLGFTAIADSDPLFLYVPGQQAVLDAVTIKSQLRGRSPNGSGPLLFPNAPTPGAANTFQFHDEIVINEIMYHERPQYATGAIPFVESAQEWVELYNRSNHAVDLTGWRFDEGIDYNFPVGTTIGAGQYLVVAKDSVSLAAKYPTIAIVGNYSGTLADSGDYFVLKDGNSNPVDEVRYFDGGAWDESPDGGGTSLELRNPFADNMRGEAWSASNEGLHSTWNHYSYRGIAAAPVYDPPIAFNEFVMGLISAGEVLLDNISVIQNPSTAPLQLLQNSTFEVDGVGNQASKWRIQGTHEDSRVIVDPNNPNNKVLDLIAIGPENYLSNHAETTLNPTLVPLPTVVNGREYEISFDAKWLSGSPQLHTELYHNDVVRTTILAQPTISGTPGAQNSTYVANFGPTYQNIQQGSVVPPAGQPVSVSVVAQDSDGIASVTLWYSANGGNWLSTAMAGSASGLYSGAIPAQSAGAVVQFYIEGQDTLGAKSTFPEAGRNSRAMIKFQDSLVQAGPRHTVRMITTAADANFLHVATNILSDHGIGATVIYDEREIFYDVDVRLRGSMFSRSSQGSTGYHIDFNPDHLFRGVHKSATMKTPSKSEILVKHVENATGIPSMYDDLINQITPSGVGNGIAILSMARHENVYLESQFEDGGDGSLYKMEGIRVMQNNTGAENLKTYMPVGWVGNFDLANLGNDKEQYRWNLQLSNNRERDDFAPLIAMAKLFSLNGTALEQEAARVLDVPEWMRVFAMMSLAGIGDVYSQGNPHNLSFYQRPSDGKVIALPWDWSFTWTESPTAALWGGSNISKLISRPIYKRVFFGEMLDLVATKFNRAYMSYWATEYGGLAGENYTGYLNNVDQRVAYVTNQINLQIPPLTFQINTNSGNNFSVAQTSTTIGGQAWVTTDKIFIDGRPDPLAVTWLDDRNWTANVPLLPGANNLTFRAVGYQGQSLSTDSIVVTNTLTVPQQADSLRITEVMFHPAEPLTGGLYTSKDFEFIELQNIGNQPLQLQGAQLRIGVDFVFPSQTLAAGDHVLVVANQAAFISRYGAGFNIAGVFTGSLNNAGEQLKLLGAASEGILDFTYSPLWQPSTDGGGNSLVIVDAAGPAINWTVETGWRASSNAGGSPGITDPSVVVSGRHLFYNNSAFDLLDAAATSDDDAAIDGSKSALRPGLTATFSNYSSYTSGINGIMVDIVGLTPTLTLADFSFRVGNANSLSQWSAAPVPIAISERAGAGVNGGKRVTLIWEEGAIRQQWLEVTVLTTAGLPAPDVFYFGNAVGETGNSPGDTQVNASDEILARNSPRTFTNPAPVSFVYDFNHDGFVNAADQIIARSNATPIGGSLMLIHPTGFAQGLAAAPSDDRHQEIAFGVSLPVSAAAPVSEPAVELHYLEPSPVLVDSPDLSAIAGQAVQASSEKLLRRAHLADLAFDQPAEVDGVLEEQWPWI